MSRTASPVDPDRRGRSFVKREGGPDRDDPGLATYSTAMRDQAMKSLSSWSS